MIRPPWRASPVSRPGVSPAGADRLREGGRRVGDVDLAQLQRAAGLGQAGVARAAGEERRETDVLDEPGGRAAACPRNA
jgi:hypothetical protein